MDLIKDQEALIAQSPANLWKPDTWNHLAAVYDSWVTTYLTFYLNGVDSEHRWIGSYAMEITATSNIYWSTIARNPSAQDHIILKVSYLMLRIVKGTALYTDDFIPPTRELKKVPGTVLLCCQDPDNPFTEATGKTITGYGDLYELDENVDLSHNCKLG